MILYEGNKSIEFTILGYEFPEVFSREQYNYDANWLVCNICYTEEGKKEFYKDPCLLTSELYKLRVGMEQIVSGTITEYRSSFIEPSLEIHISRQKKYMMFRLKFSYQISCNDRTSRQILSYINEEDIMPLLDDIKRMEKHNYNTNKDNLFRKAIFHLETMVASIEINSNFQFYI